MSASGDKPDTDKGNNYGNGNAIGAFLNEKALWNDNPRNGGVVDMTGNGEVQNQARVVGGSLPPQRTWGAPVIRTFEMSVG